MDIFKDQMQFMQACEQTVYTDNDDQKSLYQDLIEEEKDEFSESLIEGSRQEQIKEAIDILVVTVGWLLSAGVDAAEAWRRVHESNMSKLTDGKMLKREDGKLLKGPSYKAPDMSGL